MKLSDLDALRSDDNEFTPVHSVAGDVGLKLVLRDYQSKEYRTLTAAHYKAISAAFADPVDVNAVTECVALIKSWNIDELECTPASIIDLLKEPNRMWIAFQVHDWVIGKKLTASFVSAKS